MDKKKPLIMVVEDNFVLLKIAQANLRRYPVEIKLARNGREAVSLFSDYDFDLILMDVMMPHMSGLDATTAIRQREQRSGKHTPIVAITAFGERSACLAAGMDDCVVKPADYDRIIERWLPQILEIERKDAV